MRGLLASFVVLLLIALPLWAASGWVEEQQFGPYLIRAEFALRDVPDLVSDLGDLQTDLETMLSLKCQPTEIQIHLFRSEKTYVNYLSKRVPDGTKRRALFVQGTDAGRVYAYRNAYRTRDLDTDVRHETTHALLHTALPFVPLWLDEGFAEYFEVSPGLREKHHPHLGEIRRAMWWKPEIEKLEAKREMLDMGKNDYRDSWGVIHFILHGPPAAREALAAYFDEIKSGKAPTPLSQHLRRRIPNLDQKIISHLK